MSVCLLTAHQFFIQPQDLNRFLTEVKQDANRSAVADPTIKGPFDFRTFTYGSGSDRRRVEFAEQADFITDSVDGSLLLDNWHGITSWMRKLYWGIDVTELPVQGRIWQPITEQKTPLVLMVHGNHTMEHFSDEGYAYLGEHLASLGYIVVSVDQNFLNLTSAEGYFGFSKFRLRDENDARAWLLLKHLEQWRQWQASSTTDWFKNVDLDNIILIGHSRGGEGVFIAALFNRLDYYPDNANLKFDFNFNIRGIVSIAPSDGQYEPRGSLVELDAINYLTIQGSADADAMVFMGASAYARVNMDSEDFYFKSSIMINSANHGQFNSDWGDCDLQPYICLLAGQQVPVMAATEQERISKFFVSRFAETVTKSDRPYLNYFQHAQTAATFFPGHYFISNYLDSNSLIIANFENDANLSSGNAAKISAQGFTQWQELKLKHHPGWQWTNLNTHAVKLAWEQNPASFTLTMDASIIHNDKTCFAFSVSNALDENSSETITNFSLQVSDHDGRTAQVELQKYYQLYPLLTRKPKLSEKAFIEPTFQSVQIPLQDFAVANVELDLTHVHSLSFVFDKTSKGKIYLDDINLTKCVGL
ncbi:hypothetical protein GCM10010919_33480 [Alishewanella longhuensis]|uniref:Alpha/beta hydrolase n=2 Tax=Alishewanella longhuensis TaxID=1091037 RepID=A0ABQ3L1Z4_9ALTE|nr:hypothetical protein GCM10010919_33480 [Alishewanella longhuensis]